MADINIDFGLLRPPNVLGNYIQGREYRDNQQQNALAMQRQQRLDTRADEEFGMRKQEYADKRIAAEQAGQKEASAEQLKATQRVTRMLRQRIGEGVQPQEAWDEVSSLMPTFGLDPQAAEKFRDPFLKNPTGVLDAVDSTVEEKWQFLQNDSGIYAGNQSTGRIEMRAAQSPKPVEMDPTKNYYVPDGGAPAPQSGGQSGGFGAQIGPLLRREGGYNASDGHSGNPVNFGINQGANPDIDVPNLTADKAAQIYKQRYWDAIGGDQLPPQAQAAVFDAAVNQGVDAAQQMWQQSGGDVGRFNQLRLERYRKTPGYDRYGKAWEARVAETGGAGGGAPSGPAGYRQIQAARPKPQEWTSDGKGSLVNVNGDRKLDPTANGGATDVIPPESGLTPIGKPEQGLYRNAVGQKFQTNRAGTIARLGGPTDEMVAKTETKIQAINETMTLVDAVDAQLARTALLGPAGRYAVNQKELARLDALTKQLQIAFKNAAELGAITGPDVPFIEAVAPNPRELVSLIQRGEYKPRLEALAKIAGTKYRAQTASFRALGGDPTGLTPLYRSPNSKVAYDREGRVARGGSPAPAPPKVGEVRKGYRFRGGDPASPQSWAKAQ